MNRGGKFFNFICSNDEDQWERIPSPFPATRALEYTEAEVIQSLRDEGQNLTKSAIKYPALFCL